LVCDAAGWGLIDKTKYPISIAAGGLAPPKVSLDGADRVSQEEFALAPGVNVLSLGAGAGALSSAAKPIVESTSTTLLT
jgi:hypothetical protein